MNLVVYPKDIVRQGDVAIPMNKVGIEHVKEGLGLMQRCDNVAYVDEDIDKFKILKCRGCDEFTGVTIDGVENLLSFI